MAMATRASTAATRAQTPISPEGSAFVSTENTIRGEKPIMRGICFFTTRNSLAVLGGPVVLEAIEHLGVGRHTPLWLLAGPSRDRLANRMSSASAISGPVALGQLPNSHWADATRWRFGSPKRAALPRAYCCRTRLST